MATDHPGPAKAASSQHASRRPPKRPAHPSSRQGRLRTRGFDERHQPSLVTERPVRTLEESAATATTVEIRAGRRLDRLRLSIREIDPVDVVPRRNRELDDSLERVRDHLLEGDSLGSNPIAVGQLDSVRIVQCLREARHRRTVGIALQFDLSAEVLGRHPAKLLEPNRPRTAARVPSTSTGSVVSKSTVQYVRPCPGVMK